MPVKKYYCDYCDKLFQDTPADRKRHVQGIQHHQAKARWYDSFKQQQIPPIPNRPLCFHFVNTGFCRYGDSCKYLHPVPNNNVQQPPIVTTPSPSPVHGFSQHQEREWVCYWVSAARGGKWSLWTYSSKALLVFVNILSFSSLFLS
ncbi:zinc finger CCCH domain-containing protein 3 isoform X1 [Glycine soja]|uniref:zinc finger CCCH domain-containing protein 3 isoform X1 n=1 Tax=Glycine soja TaxID=3848 RepID=UPI00103B04F8|nr:zinc finger CCCH domain-containing protein 3 isoform X1 [Glycine soja]